MKTSKDVERESALLAASLMVAAARTAPKGRGIDNIEIVLIDDEPTRDKILQKMRELASSESRPSMERDAGSCAGSHAFVVIGVKSNPAGLNCGFCGYAKCQELKDAGGICAFNSMDLGIAVSSAVQVAAQLHIDNRIMYSIGRASMDLKILSGNVKQALGIPLSVTGKSPFFDRK